MNTLIVFANFPEAGKVKPMIAEKIGDEKAAKLYQNFLLDAFEQYSYLGKTTVKVYFSPENRLVKEYRRLLPNQFHLKFQVGNDFGNRVKNALADELFHGSCIVIGTDHPNLPSQYIKNGFAFLNENPDSVVVGKNSDGGCYLIGVNKLHHELFGDASSLKSEIYAEVISRIKMMNVPYLELPEWYDVDEWSDVEKLKTDLQNKTEEMNNPKRTVNYFLTQLSGMV